MFKSVVMVADISGFSKLTEFLQKRGAESSEILSFAINRYLELLVKYINRSGGDIFKYAGGISTIYIHKMRLLPFGHLLQYKMIMQ
jgi:class 3 adenylate cyclase